MDANKMYFIGVTTRNSIINQIFPVWMEMLNCNMQLKCVDLSMNATVDDYRECVNEIKSNQNILGALVTTHKIPIYSATHDLFDKFVDSAQRFKEIGCIYKRDHKLIGEATDILTVKNAFNDIWIAHGYKDKSHVQICILGCGGAGVALSYAILSSDYPNICKVIMVDNNEERLKKARGILELYDVDSKVSYNLSSSIMQNDTIVSNLTQNAFVVNATGLGKDLPGSPISSKVCFPLNGCVWEYNYRGELVFLDIAKQQITDARLSVHDGFNYFIYGWITVISRILDIEIDMELFHSLAKEARGIYDAFTLQTT